jgi:hypothetical protein
MRWFKPKEAEVLNHWYALLPRFSISAQDFYTAVEQELADCQVPGMTIERVEFAEGGLLSAKREYLRLTRERLVFDVGAAPFGTAYFFSCRFGELPLIVPIWTILILVTLLYLLTRVSWQLFGLLNGTFLLIMAAVTAVWLLRNAVALGLKDLDAALLRFPLTSAIYQVCFRRETYYRQDTRLMYCDLIDRIVKARVEEVTAAEGVRLIRYHEHSPLMKDLYQPTEKSLPEP